MNPKRFYLALSLALLFVSNLAHAQDQLGPQPKRARTLEDYKLRTLKEIAALGSDLLREAGADRRAGATVVHGDLLPSRVRVRYKGSTRPLTETKKNVISQWAQRYAGNPEHYTGPYTTEVLFSEGGVDHWLVVNTSSLDKLKQNLRQGRAVDLFLIRLGAFRTRGKWRWVLLVEDSAGPKIGQTSLSFLFL